jgi:hypothetical protein
MRRNREVNLQGDGLADGGVCIFYPGMYLVVSMEGCFTIVNIVGTGTIKNTRVPGKLTKKMTGVDNFP